MQQVSDAFLAAISGDHDVAVRVEILQGGGTETIIQVIDSVADAAYLTPKPSILDGTVTMEKKNETRSHCQVRIVDSTFSLVPNLGTDPLAPFGNEMRVYRGVRYANGSTEMPCLGTFRISNVETDDSQGGVTITVTGYDRSRSVARNVLTTFYSPAPTIFYTDAIRAILADRYPRVVFNLDATTWAGYQNDSTVKTPANWNLVYQDGANMWSESRRLAFVVGCDLFFNRLGQVTLIPDPNMVLQSSLASLSPVYSFAEGSTAMFIDLKRKFADDRTYNRVIITGEGNNLGTPLKSVAADNTDTKSPTYIGGQYGVVPLLETNSLVVTQAQADQYAQLRLRTSIGASELVEMQSIVNTALDVDDPISVTRARMNVNTTYIIDSLQIPLRAENATRMQLREKRSL